MITSKKKKNRRGGKGYAKKLEEYGLYTMGDIDRCSIGKENELYNEDLLYRLFGVNAGFFGGYNDYDAKGHKIGETRPGFFCGMNHYDSRGHKVGETRPGFFGGMNHYDDSGRKTGHSDRNFLGDWNHYDD